jgi:hypothetical protein
MQDVALDTTTYFAEGRDSTVCETTDDSRNFFDCSDFLQSTSGTVF